MDGNRTDGGPAFPPALPGGQQQGLSVREYIAAHVLGNLAVSYAFAADPETILAAHARERPGWNPMTADDLAGVAVELADALLVALQK